MALDPEELKRQRAERAKQRRSRRKKLRIRLIAAAAAAAACGLLIFFTTRPPGAPPGATVPSAVPPTTVPAVSSRPEETMPPTTTIHVAAAGDLNVTDSVVYAGGDSFDFTQTFMDVAHLLADADLTALNFEGTLCGAPYGKTSMSAPQKMMEALSGIGVDVIQLANSYSIYQGTSGLASTINGVRTAGMEPLGVYADQKEFSARKGYTIRQVQGIRVGLVAFTKGMDGMALPSGSEHCVNVLYTDYESTYQAVDTKGISQILDNLAKEKPDITIALLHWGSEYNDTISSSQEAIVKLMQQKGVDAIIGTHSHYVQQMKYDPDAGTFVAYSLGDFFGDAGRAGSEYSVILDLEITKDNEAGTTAISGFTYTPIFTVTEDGGPPRVVRIREAVASYEGNYIERYTQKTYEKMKYALGRIDERIAG